MLRHVDIGKHQCFHIFEPGLPPPNPQPLIILIILIVLVTSLSTRCYRLEYCWLSSVVLAALHSDVADQIFI